MTFTSPFEETTPELVVRDAQKIASALSIPSLGDQHIEDTRRISIGSLNQSLFRILRHLALSRLYYYEVPGVESANQESIINETLNRTSEEARFSWRARDLSIAGLVKTKERIYIPLIDKQEPVNNPSQFGVVAVVVFRIGSPVAVVRVASDDVVDAAERQLQSITGGLLESPELITFNQTFHEEFERAYINNYSELWIDVSTDKNLNKVHLTSSQWGDPRESEIAKGLLSETSKNRLISGRVTMIDGTDLYFQWEQSRISVMSNGNNTLNQVADYVRRSLIKLVDPPVVRTVNVTERPIRLEVYDEYYAATWTSVFPMNQFIALCERLDINPEAQFTVDTEGDIIGQGPWQQREEAFELNEKFTFLRVDDDSFSLVWERRGDWNLVSVIADNRTEKVSEIYSQIEDNKLAEETKGLIGDYLERGYKQ